ncbi:MAG: hypothetical protein N2423_10360, partial [Novosphingobium sp.]|nr:hypothetical protein [Novosphingobium sp.]
MRLHRRGFWRLQFAGLDLARLACFLHGLFPAPVTLRLVRLHRAFGRCLSESGSARFDGILRLGLLLATAARFLGSRLLEPGHAGLISFGLGSAVGCPLTGERLNGINRGSVRGLLLPSIGGFLSARTTPAAAATSAAPFLRGFFAWLLGQMNSAIFSFFLDGSRHTYKVDDMSFQKNVYPIIAGQVGVGC